MSVTTTKWPDSTLDIEVKATLAERDEGGRVNREVFLKTDTTVMFRHHLNLSLINLDHYFQPPADLFYDYPDRQTVNGKTAHLDFSEFEFVFDLYENELKEAIECRAGEDNTQPWIIANEWTRLASNADHVPEEVATMLSTLIEQVGHDDSGVEA